MTEFDTSFSPEKKDELSARLFISKEIPDFGKEIDKVDYTDGCKVYFKDDSWIVARFSGTEPLMRIFCEAADEREALKLTDIWRRSLGL